MYLCSFSFKTTVLDKNIKITLLIRFFRSYILPFLSPTDLSTKQVGGKIAAFLQAFGCAVGLWGLANVLQCGSAISRCSFSFYSFSNQPKIVNGDFFLRLVANVGGMVSCRIRSDHLSRYNELDKREKLETGTATAINYTTC